MIRVEKEGLVFYQSENLLEAGVENYFLTRSGGVSEGAFESLNLSYRVGDEPKRVRSNYEKLKKVLGISKIITVHQVHGGKVLDLEQEEVEPEVLRNKEADGIITRRRGIGIGALVADCFPVILVERQKRILVVAHAGRRGVLAGVIENSVRAILERGGKIDEIVGAVGPGICQRCYLVDELVVKGFQEVLGDGASRLWSRKGEGYELDLRSAVVWILKRMGILDFQIEVIGLCTCCKEEFFSHRGGRGGRQIGLAWLR